MCHRWVHCLPAVCKWSTYNRQCISVNEHWVPLCRDVLWNHWYAVCVCVYAVDEPHLLYDSLWRGC